MERYVGHIVAYEPLVELKPCSPLVPLLSLSQVDVWAVGILAYELLVGHPPFEKESRMKTYESIMHSDPEFPAWVTPDAQSFICAALCKVSRSCVKFGKLI